MSAVLKKIRLVLQGHITKNKQDKKVKTNLKTSIYLALGFSLWAPSCLESSTPEAQVVTTTSQALITAHANAADHIATNFPGNVGVYIKNLSSGQVYTFSADTPHYQASVTKIALLVGAVDQLQTPAEVNDQDTISLEDMREEGNYYKLHHVGYRTTRRIFMEQMISQSDTTATDLVVSRAGQSNIQQTLNDLDIEGLGEVTSMAYHNHLTAMIADEAWAHIPQHIAQPALRKGIYDFVLDTHGAVPAFARDGQDSGEDHYERYFRTQINQPTPRAMGSLLEKIAHKNTLGTAWKDDLIQQVFSFGGSDRVEDVLPMNWQGNFKGGGYVRGVKNVAGIAYTGPNCKQQRVVMSGCTPEAIIVLSTRGATEATAERALEHLAFHGLRAVGINAQAPVKHDSVNNGQTLNVTWPSSGQHVLNRGNIYNISWSSSTLNTGGVRLELVRDDRGKSAVVQTISASTFNDGTFSWTVPSTLSPGAGYKLRITDQTNNIVDESELFTIDGSIRISEPHGGEMMVPGTSPIGSIKWSSLGISGNLTIELWRRQLIGDAWSDTKLTTLHSNALDDGSWSSWQVPSYSASALYYFKIRSNTETLVEGQSDYFYISDDIKVTSNQAGAIYAPGTTPTFNWSSPNITGRMEVGIVQGHYDQVFNDTPFAYKEVISTNAINDGSWSSWTVPTSIPDGENYRFYVKPVNGGAVRGVGPLFQFGSTMTWQTPSLLQETPDTLNTAHTTPHHFMPGSKPTLRWSTKGALNNVNERVRIELMSAGNIISTITSNTYNDGAYAAWTVPNLTAGADYQLLITSLSRPNVSAKSYPFQLGFKGRVRAELNQRHPTITRGQSFRVKGSILNAQDERPTIIRLQLVGDKDTSGNEPVFQSTTRLSSATDSYQYIPAQTLPAGARARLKIINNNAPSQYAYGQWLTIQ